MVLCFFPSYGFLFIWSSGFGCSTQSPHGSQMINQGNLIRGEREGGDEVNYLGSFGLQCELLIKIQVNETKVFKMSTRSSIKCGHKSPTGNYLLVINIIELYIAWTSLFIHTKCFLFQKNSKKEKKNFNLEEDSSTNLIL